MFLNSCMCSCRLQLSVGLIQKEKQAWERGGNGKVLSADAELGKWSELLMSLIACGVTGNVEPLFVCSQALNSRILPGFEEVNMSGSLKNTRLCWDCMTWKVPVFSWVLTGTTCDVPPSDWRSDVLVIRSMPLQLVFSSLWRLEMYLVGLAVYCFTLLFLSCCKDMGKDVF